MPDLDAQFVDLSAHRSGVGGVMIVVIVAVVAGWLYTQRPQTPAAASTASRLSAVESNTRTGFRSDAWFLPDDDLLGFVEIPAGPFLMGSEPARCCSTMSAGLRPVGRVR